MSTTDIGTVVWNVFGVAAVFSVGLVAVVYIPAMLQLLLVKIRLFLIYRPPEYYHRTYLENVQKQIEAEFVSTQGSSARSPFSSLTVPPLKPFNFLPTAYDSNEEIKNFFGYYDQTYFKKPRDSCMAYAQNNFILLVIIAIQITLLAATFIVFIVSFNVDISTMASSALISTVLALSHFSDYVRGYFAYIWFIWSNKLRLGDEIVIDNERGDLVEFGPVTSYIYVYMRAVPMIGSVEAPNSSDPMTVGDVSPQPPARPALGGGAHKSSAFPRQVPENYHEASLRMLPNMQTFSVVARPGSSPSSPVIVNMHPSTGQLPQEAISLNGPFTLRNFGPRPKIHEVKSSEVNAHPESLHRLQMHSVGYVALPLAEHYRYQINTSSLLSSNFRNYSYHSVHAHVSDSKKNN